MTWDDFFMGLAQYVAQKSKDRSRKIGAVIVDDRNTVVSLGLNGFPRGVNDNVEERHQRPQKYLYSEHAERNAIYNAKRDISGCIMFINWYPCCDCTRAIIQSDIRSIVCLEPDWNDVRWGKEFLVSKEMLEEANVNVRFIGKNM